MKDKPKKVKAIKKVSAGVDHSEFSVIKLRKTPNIIIDNEALDPSSREFLLPGDRYCYSLKEMKINSGIKKKQLSEGDYLEYINNQINDYITAVDFFSTRDEDRAIWKTYKTILKYLENELETGLNSELPNTKDIALDLSDTSAIEKIIFLNELGIIKLLREMKIFVAANSLANVLSAITGENQSTLQSILNTMISNNVSEKNHPYKSTKTLAKVQTKLLKLGFKQE